MQVGLFAVFIAPESGESWKDSGTANLPSPSGFQMCICGEYAPNMEGFASLERPLLVSGSQCILRIKCRVSNKIRWQARARGSVSFRIAWVALASAEKTQA
ncbi:hypothetical protein BDV09DRAFT_50404 [Aspergillus tetrazonus]